MSEPFISEIRVFGFNFAPKNWSTCDGQTIDINQNGGLYALIGTRYGGDGRSTFALPDLRGRAPVHRSGSLPQGHQGGSETVTLQKNDIPSHIHDLMADASENASTNEPSGNALGKTAEIQLYADPATTMTMNPNSVAHAGGNRAHYNMQPSLVLNFCIALTGIYPSRN